MKNSYNESASSDLPVHLFEWAVGNAGDDGSTVATKVITESSDRTKNALHKETMIVNAENDLADFGSACVDVLSEAGFEADFDIDIKEGSVQIFFEDVDGVYNKKRAKFAKGLVSRLTEHVGGKITKLTNPDYGSGGNITVGMLSGVGFGGVPGIDPNFDVYAARQFEVAGDLDANVSNQVINRLNELSRMWDGSYNIYNEAVSITLKEMGESERTNLKMWIEENKNRVGIPGTTLEEVLYDVHRRILSF